MRLYVDVDARLCPTCVFSLFGIRRLLESAPTPASGSAFVYRPQTEGSITLTVNGGAMYKFLVVQGRCGQPYNVAESEQHANRMANEGHDLVQVYLQFRARASARVPRS